LLKLVALILLAGIVSAAPPSTQKALVRIPFWTDADARIAPDEVKASANGQPAEIVAIHSPGEDLLLLVVLDLVGDLNEIDLARTALESSVAELPENVFVGLMRAQDGLQVLQDPTEDREVIINALQAFAVSGTPGLIETIETVSELADSILGKSPVRLAICYITDSDIREYREDFTNPVINYSDSRDLSRRFPEGLVRERISKLDAKLAMSQAPIFVIHLEYYSDRLNEAYQAGLLQLTTATGGDTVFCRSNSEIIPAVENMLRTIVNHYRADLRVNGKAGDNVDVMLEGPNGPLSCRTRVKIGKAKKK
jgi:hypothetical protein